MKRILVVAILALSSCTMLTGPDGDLRGIDVVKAAAVLRTTAAQIEAYDLNKDGLISMDEAAPLGLAVANALYMEMRRSSPAKEE